MENWPPDDARFPIAEDSLNLRRVVFDQRDQPQSVGYQERRFHRVSSRSHGVIVTPVSSPSGLSRRVTV
jgi:hypothetical protein